MDKYDNLENLAPWYVNQTLNPGEIERYEAWLEKHPEACVDISFWQDIRRTVVEQPHFFAPPDVIKNTQARIEKAALRADIHRRTLTASLTGLVVAILVFSLLWLIVKPGTTLRWSLKGTSPASFRIYRAPSGSDTYSLVGEVTARDNQLVYQYSDPLLIPGLSYLYRVEGINSNGGIAFSQPVASDPFSILPSQLSILLTSMIMGYVCLSFLKSGIGLFPKRVDGVMA